MRRRWLNCSATLSEDRVAADGTSVGTPLMTDQAGMRAIGAAVAQLSDNPYPPEAFRWGEVLRLRVGQYRIMYTVEGDLITILRVDRRTGPSSP